MGGRGNDDMHSEQELREKLRKIEALFAGAATPGEKAAAGAAAARIRERLNRSEDGEEAVETRFSVPDPWSRKLFIALCRRYGLKPYRYPRMHRQTIIVRVPESFVGKVLWPEFKELDAALCAYLADVTERVISEEVHRDTGDADEVAEPARIGR
ncbi:MAG: hypothetical protein ACK4QW_18510 [Alphaproteobacteria bacterium]